MPSRTPSRGSITAAPARRGDHLLVAVNPGAEAALVARQQAILPQLSRAAWRRGVVTFTLAEGLDPADDFFPDLFFAQAVCRSYGQVKGSSVDALADAAIAVAGRGPWDAIHVWHREEKAAETVTIHEALRGRIDMSRTADAHAMAASPGDLVLDCLVDSPERWWIGWHRAHSPWSCLPGGMHPVSLPPGKVSRAWLKLDEAIATSGIAFRKGERACELGASPGGACQRLLEAGLKVVGIDPAVVDPSVTAHPKFEQWRMRARDVKLAAFRGFDWFVADMNIDPASTMESLGRALTASGVRPKGTIVTLKLPDGSRAAEIPGWLEQFRGWGQVPRMARQLSTGGREICVVTTRGGASGRRQ